VCHYFFISVFVCHFLCLHLLVLISWRGFGLSYLSVSSFFWRSLSPLFVFMSLFIFTCMWLPLVSLSFCLSLSASIYQYMCISTSLFINIHFTLFLRFLCSLFSPSFISLFVFLSLSRFPFTPSFITLFLNISNHSVSLCLID
jgi:hypothetical protein